MKVFINRYGKTLLFFALVGLVGGFFTGIYMLESYPADMRQQLLDQGITEWILGFVTAVQSAGYGIVLGALGILLGKKVGLWKEERAVTKRPLLIAAASAVLGGLVMILPDLLFFGRYSPVILDSYAAKPTIPYLLAAVTYGAVIEEVMLRLFAMSLAAYLLHKLFGKKQERPAASIFIAANVVTAILFAAGHLPATFTLLGRAPLIILRCFLLNGGLGLLFGWLYRKYGLRYAMLAHGGCHLVSKLIWMLFL